MQIPLTAQVEYTDDVVYGRSASVIIDPVKDHVAYLVVKGDSDPNTDYIVSVEFVTETVANTIRLNCSKAKLEKMEPFIITNFYPGEGAR